MFTGIVEYTGRFCCLERMRGHLRLKIELHSPLLPDVQPSESISVSGVCLTVVKAKDSILSFDLLEETYQKTSLGSLRPGDYINFERALKVGDRLGGHFVTGHVDGVGTIESIRQSDTESTFLIKPPIELMPYLVRKGSISVEGVSLTLGKIRKNDFEVYLIPWTLSHTNLGHKKEGDLVNLEVDTLARYARGEKPTIKVPWY